MSSSTTASAASSLISWRTILKVAPAPVAGVLIAINRAESIDQQAIVDFFNDPVGFVVGIVASWFVRQLLTIAGYISMGIRRGFGALAGVVELGGTLVTTPLAIVGGTLLSFLQLYNQTLLSLAEVAGPLAPFVVVVGYALFAVGTGVLIRLAITISPYP